MQFFCLKIQKLRKSEPNVPYVSNLVNMGFQAENHADISRFLKKRTVGQRPAMRFMEVSQNNADQAPAALIYNSFQCLPQLRLRIGRHTLQLRL